MKAQTLSLTQVSNLLHCPPRIISILEACKWFPVRQEDGSYSVADVKTSMRQHPWLRQLNIPMCERELAQLNPTLRIPRKRGVIAAGRTYCRLWEILDASFHDLNTREE
ncbi:hypothetical protein [Bombiscardovia coagulans]|uniref:Uncharacterized protein n=1 Tax=Bombiscardovia coagulans TaxID=686666 RepID=A0A261ESL4_9BIFI|nr:hypothetical protein [Bombiscardovia coagulans]OZG49860.1 hypothetical protein BOCO_0377 [Bombiscardovia coagulans]